jgi:small G protein signaling modulator 3
MAESTPTFSPLERSVSAQSTASARSSSARASTTRGLSKSRKLSAATSSASASSIAASERSLTYFPSLSPESPRAERSALFGGREDREGTPTPVTTSPANLLGHDVVRSPGLPEPPTSARSIVDDLTTSSPRAVSRGALFDEPLATHRVPGALHAATDAHIMRLITKHGAVELVRHVAGDLATRDAQIAALRRRSDERERALRKIILECGLSNMDLETRLRSIENEMRSNGGATRKFTGEDGHLSDLMSDAMSGSLAYGGDGTIRASSYSLAAADVERGRQRNDTKNTSRGWKDYLWGTNKTNSKVSSRASSASEDGTKAATVVRTQTGDDRRPRLADDLFTPPESASMRSSSRASSVSGQARKPSLASMALRLVVGGSAASGDGDRGRANSVGNSVAGSARVPSNASARTTQSARAVSTQGGPKALMAMRRGANVAAAASAARATPQERWDGMLNPPSNQAARQESFGPVEMDTILPAEAQPPTLTHMYKKYAGEYLIDPFGFIYDQRRKRKQREAAQMSRHKKNNSRANAEMLTNGPSAISPTAEEAEPKSDDDDENRPGSPNSLEEPNEEGRPKRWQDYLKMATFPTELLSHMPSMNASSLVVMDGAEDPPRAGGTEEPPKSPGLIMPDDRGFAPTAAKTTAIVDETASAAAPAPAAGSAMDPLVSAAAKDDAEPVKLLLQQLSDVHENNQRERTIRWNEFLRKVRAERKREGDAAAAAAAAAAEARFEQPGVHLPEATLMDGEIIGIASLGNKGRVGLAKGNELRNLIRGGIPLVYRSKVWSECSGAFSMKVPGYYDDLVSQLASEHDGNAVQQIDMDIGRTLTDNIFFRKGPGVQKLKEVLLAYARRNPEVGYCQGMNLIAANLLLVTPSSEDAFYLLAAMVENILPKGYYDHQLLTSRADQQVLRHHVAKVLPKLSAHLEQLGVELEALTFQWFLSVFTDCLSAEALFRVWDVVLCSGDGSTFLFRVALALLKLNEPELLACDTPASVYTYLNHRLTNHAISIDGLIQAGEALRKLVRREDVEVQRAEAVQKEEEVMRKREEENAARREARKATRDAASVKSRETIEASSGEASDPTGTAAEGDADGQQPTVSNPA